jgi:hypothetical protein
MADVDSSKEERAPRASTVVLARILAAVDDFIENPTSAQAVADKAAAGLPPDVLSNLGALERLPKTQPYTYRDALIVQLGFGLDSAGMDHTIRAEGARSVGDKLGKAYPLRHIPSVKGAFKTLAKTSPSSRAETCSRSTSCSGGRIRPLKANALRYLTTLRR